MTWMDHGLMLALGLVVPVWSYWDYGRFKAQARAGVPGVRLAAYAEGMIALWLLVAAAVLLWIPLCAKRTSPRRRWHEVTSLEGTAAHHRPSVDLATASCSC